jgi:SAM-dependent methyltransferase
MADVPDDFVADLRRLRPWPELTDSLWRSPSLVRLTHGRLWQLIARHLPARSSRVLDVGCGPGLLSLEVARAGHDVVAIDPDPEALAIAGRSAVDAAPGRVTYVEGEVGTWEPDTGGFDVVVTSRTLHHVADPAVALERIRGWLRPGGRLVCVDFVHDRFDRRAARWLAQVRGLLEAAGRFHDGASLPSDPDEATERVEWEWEQEHVVEHRMNTSREIEGPLHRLFLPDRTSWHPYLYWDILVGLQVEPRQLEGTGRLVADWEAVLLEADQLPAVLFAFAGRPLE